MNVQHLAMQFHYFKYTSVLSNIY